MLGIFLFNLRDFHIEGFYGLGVLFFRALLLGNFVHKLMVFVSILGISNFQDVLRCF